MSELMEKFQPDFVAELTDLPLAELRARGVGVLAFDLDHTLTHSRARQLESHTLEYLAHLRASGFKLILASNAVSDVTPQGDLMGAMVVRATWLSRKPMKIYFRRIIKAAQCEPGRIAMIGDRVFTDILGGNRAGLVTVRISHKRF